MSVFRVEKTKNYTVMSNYHLKDKNISLKAKGLLSVMLALPEDWDYSIRGLTVILMEGVTAISNILKELEAAGYIERNLIRGRNGKIKDTEYVIYEKPLNAPDELPEMPENKVQSEKPQTKKPQMDFLFMGYHDTACKDTEDLAQLNTNIINTKELNTNLSISEDMDGRIDVTLNVTESHEDIKDRLAENIDYTSLVIDEPENREIVDECLSIMADVLEEGEDRIRISGKNIPYCKVRERFLQLNRMHMDYVLESLKNTTCKINNIRSYLIAVLYNAPATMNLYYKQRVQHDMYGGGWKEKNIYERMDAALAGFQVKGAVI